MEVEIISWKIYMIMEFFFDFVGFKHQHLFEFNLCHMILNKMFILLKPSF
jgi:hypothetical protein